MSKSEEIENNNKQATTNQLINLLIKQIDKNL